MEISAEQLEKFRAIYKKKFGTEITLQHALEEALPLLTLMKSVYLPMTHDDLKRVEESRKTLFLNN